MKKIFLIIFFTLFAFAFLSEQSFAQVNVRNTKQVFQYYGVYKDSVKLGGVAGNPVILWGTGTPQKVLRAPIGSMYIRTNGVTDSTLYLKEQYTNTDSGWVTK